MLRGKRVKQVRSAGLGAWRGPGVSPDRDDFPSAGFPCERSCFFQLARRSTAKMWPHFFDHALKRQDRGKKLAPLLVNRRPIFRDLTQHHERAARGLLPQTGTRLLAFGHCLLPTASAARRSNVNSQDVTPSAFPLRQGPISSACARETCVGCRNQGVFPNFTVPKALRSRAGVADVLVSFPVQLFVPRPTKTVTL